MNCQRNQRQKRLIEISTDYRVMVAKLYHRTSQHRDNFINLVEQIFFSLLFPRIGNQFMTQGGDHTSKNATDVVPPGGGSSPVTEFLLI